MSGFISPGYYFLFKCFPIKIKNKINYKQGVKDERLKVVKHSSSLFSYFSHSLMLC